MKKSTILKDTLILTAITLISGLLFGSGISDHKGSYR